jgi:hypothetical protein
MKILLAVTGLCAGLGAPGLCIPPAHGQELPAEGKFSITYTAVNPNPIKPLALSGERELIVNPALMTALNDGGSGLLHNMAGRCFVFTTIDRGAKTLDVRGHCVYSDRSGDQVYEDVFTPAPLALGAPVKFRGKWTGGTGKYAGLSGEFDIVSAGSIASDGPTHNAGKKIGSYKISK